MKILWLTWKDTKHPQAGGAEVVNEELAKRLVKDGHEVFFLVGGFKGCTSEAVRDGFRIVRLGGRFSVYFHVYRYYKKHLQGWANVVIDEVNTMPFFAKYYVKEKNILFVHQLAREIWFYQMFFPISLAGYLVEPIYLWLLRDRKTITISESTRKDLMRFGHKAENISIISEGIELSPVESLEKIQKYDTPTLLALGSVRPMKRTLESIQAFEKAKEQTPELRLIVSGDTSGSYGSKVLRYIQHSPYKNDIEVFGRVSDEKKIEIMQKCHVLLVTSVKEGWGLIVTEANSQGTPAVVYNVDGLRDSVRHEETGLICSVNTPEKISQNIVKIFTDKDLYSHLQYSAWEWSKEITFDKGYTELKNTLKI